MARLDRTRMRVLCDDYGRCAWQLATIVDRPGVGRVLLLPWGWRKELPGWRDATAIWRWSARRASRTPPARLATYRHANELWQAPMLIIPQYVVCPSPRCADRDPQLLSAELLDVVPATDFSTISY